MSVCPGVFYLRVHLFAAIPGIPVWLCGNDRMLLCMRELHSVKKLYYETKSILME